MDHMIQFEKKPPGGPDYHSVENALLMQVSNLYSETELSKVIVFFTFLKTKQRRLLF